ncbi:hypothetical protein CLU79DRAFT_745666 [Phycomyces nitens]|nr:hypothetical protein CLU79DRAFT_745666 [Phycomyces nitens]
MQIICAGLCPSFLAWVECLGSTHRHPIDGRLICFLSVAINEAFDRPMRIKKELPFCKVDVGWGFLIRSIEPFYI